MFARLQTPVRIRFGLGIWALVRRSRRHARFVGGALLRTAVSFLALSLNFMAFADAAAGIPAKQNSQPAKQEQKPDAAPGNPAAQRACPMQPASSAQPVLTDGTSIHMRFVDTVDSSLVLAGETVPLEVREPVCAGNLVVIAEHSPAAAIVTLAQAKRSAGKGGTLALKIEGIRLRDGEFVSVRAEKAAKGGGHQALYLTGATVGFAAGPLMFLIYVRGESAKIPEGTEMTAYIIGDHLLDPHEPEVVGAMLLAQPVTQTVRAHGTSAAPAQSAPGQEPPPQGRNADEAAQRLGQLACGPSHVRLLHHAEKEPQAFPEAAPDKGLIYVIRPRSVVGSAIQTSLAMDGSWVGVNRVGNYFYVETDPGPHYFCGHLGGSLGLLSLWIEKGKTYYLRETVTMGGLDLDVLDEKDGKQHLAQFRRSFFEERPKK